MQFIHGSKNKICPNEGFKLFDYNLDLVSEKTNNNLISSGLDVEGIGIYCFNGNNEDNLSNSISYSGKNGYSYILSIDDFSEKDFLNYREPDEIPNYLWMDVLESFMADVRNQKGFNEDYFLDLLQNIESFQLGDNLEWREENKLSHEEINHLFSTNGLSLETEEFYSQHNFDNFEEWADSMRELFETEEPFYKITEEGGTEHLLEYSINKSDNLWETIKHIGENFAMISRGNSFDSYNRTFQKHVISKLHDFNLKAGLANNDRFVVIFDVDAISIDKVIKHEHTMDKKIKVTI